MVTDADILALVDVSRLRACLDPVLPLDEHIELSVLSGGRSNLTYLLRSDSQEYVLRRRPLGVVASGAHDMAREFRVQSALQDSDLPLAPVHGFFTDEDVMGAPFYVMTRVHGTVFHHRADVAALNTDQARAVSEATVEVLDQLHRVDYDAAGLGNLGRPDGFVRRRIGRWLDQWHSSDHRPHELVEPLGERLATLVPERTDASLVHGDYRLGNMMIDLSRQQSIAALLDWEMSTLGDPLTDLAHLLVYWDRTRGRLTHESQTIAEQPGFLTSTQLAELYAHRSGRDLTNLDFYLAFEHWRAAIIKEGIYSRTRSGDQADDDGDDLGDTVARHLEEASEILNGS